MPYRILIADDDIDIQNQISYTFQEEVLNGEMKLFFCKNGKLALDTILENLDFDLLITDLEMPELNGIQLLQEVKSLDLPMQTVILSAHDDLKNIRMLMNYGAFDFIPKPLDLTDLRITVQKTLHHVEQLKLGDKNLIENEVLKLLNLRLKKEIASRQKAEQNLKESEMRFQTLTEASFEGIILHHDGIVIDANPAFLKITGYVAEEIQNKHINDFFIEEIAGKLSLLIHGQNGTDHSIETICERKNGGRFDALVIGGMVPYDGETVCILAIRDITEQKRIQRLREDVERIVRHDLKNPLNGIIGFSGMILTNRDLPETIKESVIFIQKSAYNLLRMINHSLDIFKMEEGTYTLKQESVNILPVLEEVEKELSHIASTKKISIQKSIQNDFLIKGDRLHIESLISNLLKNALEASPENKPVTVSIFTDSLNRISIHNDGAIHESIRPHFFERYATFGKVGGTGLGTYSAKLIAVAHGGDISFQTSQSAGTTITVSLPVTSL